MLLLTGRHQTSRGISVIHLILLGSMDSTRSSTPGMNLPCSSFYSHLTIHIRDSQFYMGEFRNLCAKEKMTELRWPQRDYVVQIARFDPAKGKTSLHDYSIISRIASLGIPDVITSYYKFRNMLKAKSPDLSDEEHPQLLLCGHGAVDDPDASIIYDQVMQLIASEPYKIYSRDIIVMRLPPSDQRVFISSHSSKLLSRILFSSQRVDVKLKNCSPTFYP